jgi:hypothetical protein
MDLEYDLPGQKAHTSLPLAELNTFVAEIALRFMGGS